MLFPMHKNECVYEDACKEYEKECDKIMKKIGDALDADLKRWAVWLVRQTDKSMGWPKSSPITNFGMPQNRTMDARDVWVQTNQEMERLNEAINKLSATDRTLIHTYYVKTPCSYRKTAKILSSTDKTIKAHLEVSRENLNKIMGEQ